METKGILRENAHVIGWILVCLGWFASTYMGYRFGSRKYANEKAETVFEEVSLLIDGGYSLSTELYYSFQSDKDEEQRLILWREFEKLQRIFRGSASRLQFLLIKYYDVDTAENVLYILTHLYGGFHNTRLHAEDDGWYDTSLVLYLEAWEGWKSDERNDGYKWRMLKQCGLKTDHILRVLKSAEKNKVGQ